MDLAQNRTIPVTAAGTGRPVIRSAAVAVVAAVAIVAIVVTLFLRSVSAPAVTSTINLNTPELRAFRAQEWQIAPIARPASTYVNTWSPVLTDL
jgi:hypothetical protein